MYKQSSGLNADSTVTAHIPTVLEASPVPLVELDDPRWHSRSERGSRALADAAVFFDLEQSTALAQSRSLFDSLVCVLVLTLDLDARGFRLLSERSVCRERRRRRIGNLLCCA